MTREINARFRDVPGHKPIATSTITGLQAKALGEGDGILQMLLWLQRTPESFLPGVDADPNDGRLRELGPSQILRWDTKKIYTALNTKRASSGLNWNELAIQIGGVNAGLLTRMARGGRTAFPQVMRITQWLGEPATKFTRASDW